MPGFVDCDSLGIHHVALIDTSLFSTLLTLVLSIFKCELNFSLNVLPEFEVLTEFNGSLNVNLNWNNNNKCGPTFRIPV